MKTNRCTLRAALTLVLLPVLGGRALAQDPTKLEILPKIIRSDHGGDFQPLCVLATFRDGHTSDVTDAVAFVLDSDAVARIERGVVFPKSNGSTQVRVRHLGLDAAAEITVVGVTSVPEPSFHRDVMPILTRYGCNSGGCHGAASGKNGFRLSLFGFDPAADHVALTRELRGRRANPADPATSLMLTKPSMEVGHKGGLRLATEHPDHAILESWITRGAVRDGATPRISCLDVLPRRAVLLGPGQRQRVLVRARYEDGTDRDVTALALLGSSNPSSAALDERGVVTSASAGEAFIMARFGTFAEVAQVLVVPDVAFTWPAEVTAFNPVDEFIHAKLRQVRLAPAALASDEVYARRLFLDLLGILPSKEDLGSFLADSNPEKRSQLVDALLRRPEVMAIWAMKWAEIFRVEEEKLEVKGTRVFSQRLLESLRDGAPFDVLIGELLTAEGSQFSEPAVNFYLVERDPKALAENVAQTLLGIRIQCAQCHNHPFECWTMDDYYGFAAFFAQMNVKPGEDPREVVVFDRGEGTMRHGATGRPVAPRFLGGVEPDIPSGMDRRRVLADWLTSGENRWFAKNVANRVWAHVFGRGLVDPPDDVRTTNPASHPELLEHLADVLVRSGFDLLAVLREILHSRTYQLAADSRNSPAALYAATTVRRLSAEQLLDAIGSVTGVPTKYRGLPLGARASEVVGVRHGLDFLDLFGRPPRTSACTCDRREEPTLGQALHLINGATVGAKIGDKAGRLATRLREKVSPEEILIELWQVAYSRRPSTAELEAVRATLLGVDPAVALEDAYWAVLNSTEFLFRS